jgi:hypothetical protein
LRIASMVPTLDLIRCAARRSFPGFPFGYMARSMFTPNTDCRCQHFMYENQSRGRIHRPQTILRAW